MNEHPYRPEPIVVERVPAWFSALMKITVATVFLSPALYSVNSFLLDRRIETLEEAALRHCESQNAELRREVAAYEEGLQRLEREMPRCVAACTAGDDERETP